MAFSCGLLSDHGTVQENNLMTFFTTRERSLSFQLAFSLRRSPAFLEQIVAAYMTALSFFQ